VARERLIVVGAGPAGVRAAQTLVAAGFAPTLIDESREGGGRIYARPPAPLARDTRALYGSDAARATAVHAAAATLAGQIDYRPDTAAWNLAGRNLYVACDGRHETLPFDALIIAAGATDRLLPMAGWQHAGCYSLGGAQLLLKTQACAIGRRVAFVGTGPLLYLIAAQYAAAGAGVAGVFDTSPWSARIGALPDLLARPATLLKGIGLELALRRAGVPVHRGVVPQQIDGDAERGVAGLRWRDADGHVQRVDCDAVALGFHLRPEAQLADLARCAFDYDASSQLWTPRVDPDRRSSVPGIYLAGDGAVVLGAVAAERSGELAALAALRDLGHHVDTGRMARLRAALAGDARFARGLARAFPWPAALASALEDGTTLCRCEGITVGELRRSCAELGAREANRAKAFTRVGMGRCQGRYCGDAAAAVIAAATGVAAGAVGRLRAQAPVKPIPVSTVPADATASAAEPTA
jgi:NADPH-dependent 2,4-dienoyl-CoA reductase/sulfur reductase-like enzyme